MKNTGLKILINLLILAALGIMSGCQSDTQSPASASRNQSVEREESPASQSQSDASTSEETVTSVATDHLVNPKLTNEQTADADVLFVEARLAEDGSWTFSVTVEHEDKGWEDYADGWDVVLPDGSAIKPDPESPFTRLLLHPHENEQPFTRSQRGIEIPTGVETVTVRAHDLVDGFGGQEVAVDLSSESGQNFEVIR